MKKIALILALALGIIIILSGCDNDHYPMYTKIPGSTPLPVNTPHNIDNTGDIIYGISTGNVANNGRMAENDGWIYFVDRGDKPGFFRIRTDGTNKQKLSSTPPRYINIIGDWIYFANGSLYKLKIDGSQKSELFQINPVYDIIASKLPADDLEYINVVDDWIYYRNGLANGNLYKTRIDNSITKQITVYDDAKNINVVGDLIYYTDNSRITRITTDGVDQKPFNVENVKSMAVSGDKIYFTKTDSPGFFKVSNDGTDSSQIADVCSGFTVTDDWVYYFNDILYKIKPDGTQKTYIAQFYSTAGSIYIIEDWIYYYKGIESDLSLYRMRIDGSGEQIFVKLL